jgi:hypothetical protein
MRTKIVIIQNRFSRRVNDEPVKCLNLKFITNLFELEFCFLQPGGMAMFTENNQM